MPGLLDYGREYMPGTDQRSALEQLRGLLSVGAPAMQAVGGLLGYDPNGSDLWQQAAASRAVPVPKAKLADYGVTPPPAQQAIGGMLAGNFMAPIKNAGLDMSQAARMARAREMGFDVDNPVYHGTTKAFKSFSMAKAGKNNDNLGRGVYVTPSTSLTESFSAGDGGQTLKLAVAVKNPFEVNTENVLRFIENDYGPAIQASRRATGAPELSEEIIKRFIEAKKWQFSNAGEGKAAQRMFLFDFVQEHQDLIKHKHDAIVMGNEMAVADPRNIRSIHAAFDPAKRNSADLLASIGGLGLLGYAGAQD